MKILEIISIGLRFFPLQLLLLHFKKSHALLLLWVFLFGFATQTLATKFGVPYLFLSPEYLGEVSWASYMILGFSIGGFFMAFHLYSYIIMGPSFPFIATLARPFYKFSINNSALPTIFYVVLIWNIYEVQAHEELRPVSEIIMDVLALTGGIILFILVSVFYFFKTNFHILNIRMKKERRRTLYSIVGTLFNRNNLVFSYPGVIYQPSYYFASQFKVLPARDARHYDSALTRDIFRQNHFNASMFELAMIFSFLILGIFQEYAIFQIPAGASYILLSTLALMVITIFYSWFKGWAISILIGSFIALNVLSDSAGIFRPENQVYGLDYSKTTDYNLEELKEIQYNQKFVEEDLQRHFEILDRWKRKAITVQNTTKPKLILVNCSGGGLRSALWTFYVFENIDRKLNGQFFPNIHMITGASGGMIGASYYRDLYSENPKFWENDQEEYHNNISKDLLNSVCFNLAIHDIFLRYKHVDIDGVKYVRDRGYAFEEQLNENTGGIMRKTLGDYADDELKSKIPMMIYSPTIINDGRRLIMSTQPMGFINGVDFSDKKLGPENVEFIKLFKDHNPMNVHYSSVLRMNSTFPYVLPMVTMPTYPEMNVMDAGIRDNYGTKTTVRYLDAIEEWLRLNTSGVVLVQIRDIDKDYDITDPDELNLMDRILKPVTNFYGNYHHTQEYDANEMIELSESPDFPVHEVSFILRKDTKEKIALSWHLTQREKNDIKKTFQNEKNQKELKNLIDLLTNR